MSTKCQLEIVVFVRVCNSCGCNRPTNLHMNLQALIPLGFLCPNSLPFCTAPRRLHISSSLSPRMNVARLTCSAMLPPMGPCCWCCWWPTATERWRGCIHVNVFCTSWRGLACATCAQASTQLSVVRPMRERATRGVLEGLLGQRQAGIRRVSWQAVQQRLPPQLLR